MNPKDDNNIMIMLRERMETHCLPKALEIKEKVDQGKSLDEFDIEFMEEIFSEIGENRSVIEHHPECERLAAYMMQLYMKIADQVIKNEQRARLYRI